MIFGAAAAIVAAALLPQSGPETIELTVRNSRFEPAEIRAEAGTTVRLVVRNLDPIAHELIVGPPAVHTRHEAGRDRHHHGDVPGEVSVGIGQTAETTYTFSEPGILEFACHLPGHYRYGMHGTVRVA
jgi:uncharacterized cupredoxin-like copper-binding protein